MTDTLATHIPGYLAGTWDIDPVHTDVSFTARHMMVSKVRGHFERFEGTVTTAPDPLQSSVEVSVELGSINTNNADRDNHLRTPDFFDAAKNPEITFKSTKMTPTGKDKYDVTGTLTMRGVSKEITIPVAYLGSMKDPGGNDRASFELSTKLNRKDYGINWNKALDNGGFMLSDDVDVTISLETVKKKPEAPAAK